jgi:hypothetical protein
MKLPDYPLQKTASDKGNLVRLQPIITITNSNF